MRDTERHSGATLAQSREQAQDQAGDHCGQCGAPVAADQRYCLNCGFHRRRAHDPVAQYLSEASAARTRVIAAEALVASGRRPRRLGARMATTLVVVALIIGLVIGNATAGKSGTPARASGTTSTQQSATTSTPKTSSPAKNATGSSYLQQEEDLPNSVTP